MARAPTTDHLERGHPRQVKAEAAGFSRLRSRIARLNFARINGSLALFTTVLALIAWWPDYTAKSESVAAFSLIRDNPHGLLRTRDIGSLPDGRHLYDIAYELILKNTSNSSFLVEFSSDRLFLGRNHYDASKGTAQVLDDPPSIWDKIDHSTGDVVDWNLLNTSVSIAEASDSDIEDVLKEYGIISDKPGHATDSTENGGMTDEYAPDHTSAHTAHYILAANPNDLASVEVTYGLAPRLTLWEKWFGTDRSSFYDANPNWEIVWLKDATNAAGKCPFGIVTENGKTSLDCSGDAAKVDEVVARPPEAH